MKIRAEQMATLEQAALQNFKDYMVEHLQGVSPKRCESVGIENVREAVDWGMKRAEKYGFTNSGPVRFYLEMMLMFGGYFDTDPQLSWASKILNDESFPDQMERADCLYEKMKEYVDQVDGPNNEHAIESLRRINRASVEQIVMFDGSSESGMITGLRILHPQKCKYLEKVNLQTVVSLGCNLAKKYSVTSNSGVALFVALTFMLGHGFMSDPLFPWITAILNDESITDANQRAEQLSFKAKTYWQELLSDFQE